VEASARRDALFGARGRADLLKITALLSLPFVSARAEAQPFSEWLARQTSDRKLYLFFDSFVQFAVSVRSHEISLGEMRAIHQNVLRYGMPGTPVGGCLRVVEALAECIREHGGDIRLSTDVVRIVSAAAPERVRGVEFRDRHTGQAHAIEAPLVVSDAGPEATRDLLGPIGAQLLGDLPPLPKAAGMKLHIVSDRSLIPHNGIMLCLHTRRVSGMVEVSRSIPALVPPGMHMIDTFQVMRTDSMTGERDLAIADLREIFGQDFDRHCRIVRTSAFRSRWPVNQAMQGFDLRDQEPVRGLVMVGDAYKPSGHMMAEGVRRLAPRLYSTVSP
jgi:phytoene dehydrogenase-like protein